MNTLFALQIQVSLAERFQTSRIGQMENCRPMKGWPVLPKGSRLLWTERIKNFGME